MDITKQLSELYLESKSRNKKQTVGIRLNQKTIERYKNLGKGYTGIMAAVLEYAISHPQVLKKALYKSIDIDLPSEKGYT